jgi:hypothetical protein
MSTLLKNTVFYVIGYLLLMTPTYILPYFGSNSLIANGLGAALGHGPMPQWWLHLWALVMLVLLGHVRGQLVGKRYLIVFPLVAAVFDMVPGLSIIPMVPTVMHALAVILGAINPVLVNPALADDDAPLVPASRTPARVAGVMSLATVAGSAWFMYNVASSGAQWGQILTGKPQPASVLPKPAPKPAPVTVQTPAEPAAPVLATVPASPVAQKRAAVKPVHSKPIVQTATSHPAAKPAPEPAAAPKVRYINLNDS